MDFDVISPKSKKELLNAMSEYQHTDFRFGAGYTDLLIELKDKSSDGLKIINLSLLKEGAFNTIVDKGDYYHVGTNVTAQEIIENDLLHSNYKVLMEATESVASTQIRNAATVGGNICTASPSGDMSCALIALESKCEILNTKGELREEYLSAFIKDVRKTSLAKNEVLRNIKIPKNSGSKQHSGFIKIGTRNSMEISIVSLAYHLQLNETGEIIRAGVAIGSAAPCIPFAVEACEFLTGKFVGQLSTEDREEFAHKVLMYASPISDIRASAWYRKEVLYNISRDI
jgi:CO/xanthine dehydrogenase FAD-binding subunit